MSNLKLIIAWAIALALFGAILSVTCYAGYKTFLLISNAEIKPFFVVAVALGCFYGLKWLVEWAVKTISEGVSNE